jgi:hypothetical protein
MRGRFDGSEEIFLPAAVTGYCTRDPNPPTDAYSFYTDGTVGSFSFDILVW